MFTGQIVAGWIVLRTRCRWKIITGWIVLAPNLLSRITNELLLIYTMRQKKFLTYDIKNSTSWQYPPIKAAKCSIQTVMTSISVGKQRNFPPSNKHGSAQTICRGNLNCFACCLRRTLHDKNLAVYFLSDPFTVNGVAVIFFLNL